MIETVEDAQYEVQVMIEESEADLGPDAPEMSASDAVVSVVTMYSLDDDVAIELCRRELGFVPYELRRNLGSIDFLDDWREEMSL